MSAAKLKAEGPSILRIGFDPGRLGRLRHEEVGDIAYHIARVLTGEASAVLEWERNGMKVDLRAWNRDQ